MVIIGCDFHPSWEQVCWLDTETGETAEQKLVHSAGEAQQFYKSLPAPALVGLEATGNCRVPQVRAVLFGANLGMDKAELRIVRSGRRVGASAQTSARKCFLAARSSCRP